MNCRLFIIFFLITVEAFASGQIIDASIVELKYKTPENYSGIAGSVIFDRVKILRNNMMVILDNDDEVFDSEIFIRSNFLGFKGKYHSFGFVINNQLFFERVNEARLDNALLNLNDQRFSFNADFMKLDIDQAAIEFENSRFFCLMSSESEAESESENLIFGCLNNIRFTPNGPKANARIKIEIKGSENDDRVIIGDLKRFELKDKSINLETSKTHITANNMKFNIEEFSFLCPKSYIGPLFNRNTLVEECFDNASVFNKDKGAVKVSLQTFHKDKEISFKSKFNLVHMDEKFFKVTSIHNNFKMHPYIARGSEFNLKCSKYINLEGDIVSDFVKKCSNSLEIQKNKWIIEEKDVFTRYYLGIKNVLIKPDLMKVEVDSFQKVIGRDFVDEDITKGVVTIFDAMAKCKNNNILDDMEWPNIIDNCLTSGVATIDRIADSDTTNLDIIFNSYNKVIADFQEFVGFNPAKFTENDEPFLKDIVLTIDKNVMAVTCKFKFLMAFRNILLSGPIRYNRQTDELEIEIEKVKLPIPLMGRSIWLAEKLLKKIISSNKIRVENKTIFIKIKV